MDPNKQRPVKIAIIGAGNVGSTCAYAILLRGIASEIVLVNLDRERAEGEAMDLNHGMLYARPARVWAGDYADCEGADIVILAAGAAQRPGESRLDLLRRNVAIFYEIVPNVVKYAGDAILLVVTNPVDVLTHITLQSSGLPLSRVIGSGTILDTARFRYLLGEHFGVEPRSIHAFIIGEHGDSQVPVWSLANIAGMKLDEYCVMSGCPLDSDRKAQIAHETREAAYEIIRLKGATYYAIAAGVVRIIDAVLRDENSILTVSSLVQGVYDLQDVCLSLPGVVNRSGFVHTIELPLAPEERRGLIRSAEMIREAGSSASQ
jgi:L-lactate dehydrogenase